jgi:3-phenylpropionate/trans-cinnamate dioxygenase ferredoxin component
MPIERTEVGKVTDFPENSMTPVDIAGREILIIHQNDTFYALPNECTHAKFPLHDGELLEGRVKCQYHGATYDLQTGRPTLPAVKKIALYTVTVENTTVYVNLEQH